MNNAENKLNKETIKEIALANGFKLKEQANGEMDLNPYVYDTINKAIAFYESQKNNGWIKITDGGFDDGQEILITDGKKVWADTVMFDCLDGYCYIYFDGGSDPEKVTHWQPMPQPPKE